MEAVMKIEATKPVFVQPHSGRKLDFLAVTLPHSVRNPLTTTFHYLFITIPAGLNPWFDALDAARQADTLDDALYRRLFLEYGIEWLE